MHIMPITWKTAPFLHLIHKISRGLSHMVEIVAVLLEKSNEKIKFSFTCLNEQEKLQTDVWWLYRFFSFLAIDFCAIARIVPRLGEAVFLKKAIDKPKKACYTHTVNRWCGDNVDKGHPREPAVLECRHDTRQQMDRGGHSQRHCRVFCDVWHA